MAAADREGGEWVMPVLSLAFWRITERAGQGSAPAQILDGDALFSVTIEGQR
jgi:hypothetical protein